MHKNLQGKPSQSLHAILLLLFLSFIHSNLLGSPTFYDKQFNKLKGQIPKEIDTPRAVISLYKLFDLRSSLSDPAALRECIEKVYSNPKSIGVVKSHALWFLSKLDIYSGKLKEAIAKRDSLGFVKEWVIIGPFDNEGKSGFDKSFPPEEKIDFSAEYDGKERKVKWRRYPDVNPHGYQNFAIVFLPNENTAAYALTYINSPEAQDVALRLASDDAAKIWLNGHVVHAANAYRSALFDQDVIGLKLNKGWNRLLVKVCQKEGDWGFRLRITTPADEGLKGLRFLADPQQIEKLGIANITSAVFKIDSAVDAIAYFEKQAADKPDSAQAHADLGYIYHAKKNFDADDEKDIEEYEKAVKLAPNEASYHYTLSKYYYKDHNKVRRSLERAIELDPNMSVAYSDLADYYLKRRMVLKGVGLLRTVLKKDPNHFPATIGLSYQYSKNYLAAKALKMMEELKKALPNISWVDYETAIFADQLGLKDRAIEAYKSYLRMNHDNKSVRSYLIGQYRARLDLDKCLELYDKTLEIFPDDTATMTKKARLLAGNGRYEEAIAMTERILKICPEHSTALQNLGDYYHHLGSLSKALEYWEESLRIKPQNPKLKEYLEYLKPKEDPFEKPYLHELDKLLSGEIKPEDTADEDAVYLVDMDVQKVYPNGLSSTFTQNVIKILTEKGVEDFRRSSVYFTPLRQEVKMKKLRLVKPSGEEISPSQVYTRSVFGGGGIYYDYRAKAISFSNVEVGDVIELQYKVSDIARTNLYADYFGNVEYFRGSHKKLLKEYILITPLERKIYHNEVALDVKPTVEVNEDNEDNSVRVYTWRARRLPGIEAEPNMPGIGDTSSYVHVSTYEKWEDVAHYYAGLIKDQFNLDSSAKKMVAKLVEGKKTELEKIQAIYDFIAKKTRYIGLEFGIHGYKPYPAYQVFARKFGDCKDKATLLSAMLSEVGVDSKLAILRTRSLGDIDPFPASLAVFNHAICYVPKYSLWLDCTLEYSGSRELPYQDRGALAMLVDRHGDGKTVKTPLDKADDNTVELRLEGKLSSDGTLTAKGRQTVKGQYCAGYRRRYQVVQRQKEDFEKSWRRRRPGLIVKSVSFSDLTNLEAPVRCELDVEVPQFAKTGQGAMSLTPNFQDIHLTRGYALLSERKHDLDLQLPWKMSDSLEISLPVGTKVIHLPEDVNIQTKFGSCVVDYKTANGKVSVRSSVALSVARVKREDYPDFREFCNEVDEELSERIRLSTAHDKPK